MTTSEIPVTEVTILDRLQQLPEFVLTVIGATAKDFIDGASLDEQPLRAVIPSSLRTETIGVARNKKSRFVAVGVRTLNRPWLTEKPKAPKPKVYVV